MEQGAPRADNQRVSPGEAQAVVLSVTLLLALAGVGVVVFRRRRPGQRGSVADVPTPAARGEPSPGVRAHLSRAREVADFVWPPPEPDPEPMRLRPDVEARLETAARMVGASGMILWVVDRAAGRLTIHAASGYTPSFLEETGAVPLDAPVLTAVAYTEGRVRTRTRRGWHLAAVAVPVEHDGRLLGVLTAELAPESGSDVTPETETFVRRVALQMAPSLAAERPDVAAGPADGGPEGASSTSVGDGRAAAGRE